MFILSLFKWTFYIVSDFSFYNMLMNIFICGLLLYTQQIFIEQLLHTRHYSSGYRSSRELNKALTPMKLCFLMCKLKKDTEDVAYQLFLCRQMIIQKRVFVYCTRIKAEALEAVARKGLTHPLIPGP